ncbi:MAG: methyltransferase domain-containing protein [Gammaproteobacteria bacterium]|jgi:SAM-dependent methyltransferase
MIVSRIRAKLREKLPYPIRRRLMKYSRWPPVGGVDFGSLRRTRPISTDWGFDRGIPIDRYYIERFLAAHAMDIRGRVLEVADNEYTRRFGGDRVTRSDILHDTEGSPRATLVADLAHADHVPSDTFDCIICTQTLQLIYDVQTAVETLHRVLKPGGTLLVTVPVITQISRADMDRTGDYWRFTSAAAKRLFAERFPGGSVTVEVHGNVLASVAFLHGLAVEELQPSELDYRDPDYEMLVTVHVVKARPPA